MSRMRTEVAAGPDTDTNSAATYSHDVSYNNARYATDWGAVIRFAAPTVGLTIILSGLIALTVGSGCTSEKPGLEGTAVTATATGTNAAQPSALQVSPPSTSTAANVKPAGPVTSDPLPSPDPTEPVVASVSTPASRSATTGPSNYTVQHGDTLFRIAKQHYGDGKQWFRIASANPGLTPANLKAGQKIVLP